MLSYICQEIIVKGNEWECVLNLIQADVRLKEEADRDLLDALEEILEVS